MFGSKAHYVSGLTLFLLSLNVTAAMSSELQASAEVLSNIEILLEKKSCPQCDLSGAELNRFDLTGANLEGADLTGAKLYLANLSGANLRHANLQEAQFGGADLGGADLRGANLTGASFAGAYMSGTLLEGEMVKTTPYAADDISDIEQNVYIDDTSKAKMIPKTEKATILVDEDEPKNIPPAIATEESSNIVKVDAVEGESPASVTNEVGYEEVTQNQNISANPNKEEQKMVTDAVIILDEKSKQKVAPAASDTDNNSNSHAKELNSVAEAKLQPVPEDETDNEVIQKKNVAPDSKTLPAINSVQIKNENATATEATSIKIGEVKEQEVETDLESVTIESEIVEENKIVKEKPEQSEEEVVEIEKELSKTIEEEPVTESVEIVNDVMAAIPETVPSDEVLQNLERLLDTKKCYGCNLVGVDLTGEDLESADLEAADLTDAVLVKADLEDANLKQANLTNADLTGADLDAADFYKANLTNANLSDATVEGAMFDDTVMAGVKGYQQEILMIGPVPE
jgi:uncharacterized protein YjbI with pentapeptide repeats